MTGMTVAMRMIIDRMRLLHKMAAFQPVPHGRIHWVKDEGWERGGSQRGKGETWLRSLAVIFEF